MYVYVRTDWYVRGVPLSVCALLLMIIEPSLQSFTASGSGNGISFVRVAPLLMHFVIIRALLCYPTNDNTSWADGLVPSGWFLPSFHKRIGPEEVFRCYKITALRHWRVELQPKELKTGWCALFDDLNWESAERWNGSYFRVLKQEEREKFSLHFISFSPSKSLHWVCLAEWRRRRATGGWAPSFQNDSNLMDRLTSPSRTVPVTERHLSTRRSAPPFCPGTERHIFVFKPALWARLVPSMEKSLRSAKNSDVRPLLFIEKAMDEVPCVHYY